MPAVLTSEEQALETQLQSQESCEEIPKNVFFATPYDFEREPYHAPYAHFYRANEIRLNENGIFTFLPHRNILPGLTKHEKRFRYNEHMEFANLVLVHAVRSGDVLDMIKIGTLMNKPVIAFYQRHGLVEQRILNGLRNRNSLIATVRYADELQGINDLEMATKSFFQEC